MATTLDDLLALLPDNSTGQIDAADLRTIVTALWENDVTLASDGTEVEARVSALENDDGTGVSVSGVWQVNPQAGTNPQAMQITADTANVNQLTQWVRIWKTDKNNTDFTAALLAASKLYGQQQAKSGNWAKADVTSTEDQGSWVQLNVDVTDSGGTGSGGWQTAVVVITV